MALVARVPVSSESPHKRAVLQSQKRANRLGGGGGGGPRPTVGQLWPRGGRGK